MCRDTIALALSLDGHRGNAKLGWIENESIEVPRCAHIPAVAVSQCRVDHIAPRLIAAYARRQRRYQANQSRAQAPAGYRVVGDRCGAIGSGDQIARGNRRHDRRGEFRIARFFHRERRRSREVVVTVGEDIVARPAPWRCPCSANNRA